MNFSGAQDSANRSDNPMPPARETPQRNMTEFLEALATIIFLPAVLCITIGGFMADFLLKRMLIGAGILINRSSGPGLPRAERNRPLSSPRATELQARRALPSAPHHCPQTCRWPGMVLPDLRASSGGSVSRDVYWSDFYCPDGYDRHRGSGNHADRDKPIHRYP